MSLSTGKLNIHTVRRPFTHRSNQKVRPKAEKTERYQVGFKICSDVKDEEDFINRPALSRYNSWHKFQSHSASTGKDLYDEAIDIFNTSPLIAIDFLTYFGYFKLDANSVANYVFYT